MGTLLFWGGHSMWEGLGGAQVSGPKALIHSLVALGHLCPLLGSGHGVWGASAFGALGGTCS